MNEGLPNSVILSDYYILILVIKTTLASKGNDLLTTDAAYFTLYYSLLLHNINSALIDTQGILGSKDIGGRKYNSATLRLKQSLAIGLSFFFVLCTLPSFFYSSFLHHVLGIEKDQAESSQKMVMWALPAMFVRTINDCLKTYLQNNEIIKPLGYAYSILVVISFPLIFFVINTLGIKESSIGLIFIIFELCGTFVCIYLAKDLMEEGKMNFSYPVTRKLDYYLIKWLKNFIVDFPFVLIFELEYYILIFVQSNADIIAFSICSTASYIVNYIAFGFSVGPRIIVNRCLGENSPDKALENVKVFKKFFLLVGLALGLIWFTSFWLLEILGIFGESGKILRKLMSLGKYSLILRGMSQFILLGLQVPMMKSIESTNIATFLYSIPYCWNNISSYFFAVYLGFGVIGVLWSEAWFFFFIQYVLGAFLDDEMFHSIAKEVAARCNNMVRNILG